MQLLRRLTDGIARAQLYFNSGATMFGLTPIVLALRIGIVALVASLSAYGVHKYNEGIRAELVQKYENMMRNEKAKAAKELEIRAAANLEAMRKLDKEWRKEMESQTHELGRLEELLEAEKSAKLLCWSPEITKQLSKPARAVGKIKRGQ